MRTKVTTAGVVIPQQWFEGVDEVEIRRENGHVVITPVAETAEISSKPIWEEFAEVVGGVSAEGLQKLPADGSARHDFYIGRAAEAGG